MLTREATRQARHALDLRLAHTECADRLVPPRLGWIRAIRDALGMSAADLAARLGVSDASVRSLETKEVTGGIRLSSLRRAAEAMDCTLVYAFVPNTSLEDVVRRQARLVLTERAARVEQTMALEAQEAAETPYATESQLREIMDSRRLWGHRGTGE